MSLYNKVIQLLTDITKVGRINVEVFLKIVAKLDDASRFIWVIEHIIPITPLDKMLKSGM